jgi:hypothetical protein
MQRLERKERKTECEEQQLVRFRTKTKLQWNREFQCVFSVKKNGAPNCARGSCGHELYYGGEEGMLHYSGHPRQASPDRLDNSNPFYDSTNVRMVCLSCQLVERDYRRVSFEAERSKQPTVAFVAANWLAAIDERIAKLTTK